MPIAALDRSILEYALKHLRAERERIEEQILSVERQLRTTKSSAPSIPTESTTPEAPIAKKTTRKKRVFSAEGKARMVAAQKERWASFHAKQKETTDMLAKLERNAKKALKKVTKKAAKKKATKKRDNSDIPF